MYRRVSFPAPALGCVCPNQDISSQSLIRIIANPLPSVPSHSHPPVVSRGPKLQDRFCRNIQNMSAQAQPTGSRPDARLQLRVCNYNETGGTKGVLNEPGDKSVDTECRTRESRRRQTW
ncbi:uncharacterized protein B0T23DRAFT_122551 [Neurospora hispaniola]|uniref:Uncharacterized protein n=1 Tax=Neurospora hispaniola TaxID=588809 RepID=A0AAJ0IAG0_9PEZI|nr:hypothetical protein B0T23DRAFT_122551 [Neurospora hispaniola]